MGTQRVQKKGVLPWLVRWALHAGTRDFCPALAALVRPVQNIFFLAVHYFFQLICPHRPLSWAVVQDRLPLIVCLWSYRMQALMACLLPVQIFYFAKYPGYLYLASLFLLWNLCWLVFSTRPALFYFASFARSSSLCGQSFFLLCKLYRL